MQVSIGIVIGLLLAIIVFLATKRLQNPIERALKQLENLTKEKGEVFIESDETRELERLLDNLPENNDVSR